MRMRVVLTRVLHLPCCASSILRQPKFHPPPPTLPPLPRYSPPNPHLPPPSLTHRLQKRPRAPLGECSAPSGAVSQLERCQPALREAVHRSERVNRVVARVSERLLRRTGRASRKVNAFHPLGKLYKKVLGKQTTWNWCGIVCLLLLWCNNFRFWGHSTYTWVKVGDIVHAVWYAW